MSAVPSDPPTRALPTSLRSRTLQPWLTSRGWTPAHTERFLNPRLSQLSDPTYMADREQVSERLARAVRERETVVVFGDYDCDGITSTVILTEVLRSLGGVALPLVASRFEGGYGLTPQAVEKVRRAGARLLVTCDCGSSDHESLRALAQTGVEAVVIDHHLVPEQPLPAVGFLNPHRPECRFPYKGLASCGLVLSVAAALRKSLDRPLDVRQWLDLVALGTIADVAPLDGDNRCLVRSGLRVLARAQRPGIRALLEIAKLDGSVPLTARDVAFRLAPHINAPGRLGAADAALDLLLARDTDEARRAAGRVAELTSERRRCQDEMLEQARDLIRREAMDEEPAIVVGQQGWNPGIVGIVAGRLADEFGKPVVVVGLDGDAGRGSVRGPAGCRLHDALRESASSLLRFGGHQAAAGLEVESSQLEAFRLRFTEAIAAQAPAKDVGSGELLLEWHPDDTPEQVMDDLLLLEPCGESNPRPALLVRGVVVDARSVGSGHLKLRLRLQSGRLLDGFGVGLGDVAASLAGAVRVVADLRHNSFPGADPIEMFISRVAAE